MSIDSKSLYEHLHPSPNINNLDRARASADASDNGMGPAQLKSLLNFIQDLDPIYREVLLQWCIEQLDHGRTAKVVLADLLKALPARIPPSVENNLLAPNKSYSFFNAFAKNRIPNFTEDKSYFNTIINTKNQINEIITPKSFDAFQKTYSAFNRAHLELKQLDAAGGKHLAELMATSLESEHMQKPVVITCEREVDGERQTLQLIGGMHFTTSNWMEQIPESILSEATCLAIEDRSAFDQLMLNQDRLKAFAYQAYRLPITENESAFSFELEVYKRMASSLMARAKPDARAQVFPIVGLENRAETLRHFGHSEYKNSTFVRLVFDPATSKAVGEYRDNQMVQTLLDTAASHSTLVAAVGKLHILGMVNILQKQGFEITHQALCGLEPEPYQAAVIAL